jgi:hypothetical protein
MPYWKAIPPERFFTGRNSDMKTIQPFVCRLSREESEVVSKKGNIILLGRSGTGAAFMFM